MMICMTTHYAGEIRTHDYQADPFGGQYKLVEQTGPNTWLVETLAPSAEVEEAILEHYANAESNGYSTCPIWDKTWAECTGDERPTIVGHKTHADEMAEELASRHASTGRQWTIEFVSAARYAEAF